MDINKVFKIEVLATDDMQSQIRGRDFVWVRKKVVDVDAAEPVCQGGSTRRVVHAVHRLFFGSKGLLKSKGKGRRLERTSAGG